MFRFAAIIATVEGSCPQAYNTPMCPNYSSNGPQQAGIAPGYGPVWVDNRNYEAQGWTASVTTPMGDLSGGIAQLTNYIQTYGVQYGMPTTLSLEGSFMKQSTGVQNSQSSGEVTVESNQQHNYTVVALDAVERPGLCFVPDPNQIYANWTFFCNFLNSNGYSLDCSGKQVVSYYPFNYYGPNHRRLDEPDRLRNGSKVEGDSQGADNQTAWDSSCSSCWKQEADGSLEGVNGFFGPQCGDQCQCRFELWFYTNASATDMIV